MSEATRTVTIGSASGLHARPAKLFTQAAKDSRHKVTVTKGDGRPVNAASILSVLALGAKQGDEVTVSVTGDDAENVVVILADIITTDHDSPGTSDAGTTAVTGATQAHS